MPFRWFLARHHTFLPCSTTRMFLIPSKLTYGSFGPFAVLLFARLLFILRSTCFVYASCFTEQLLRLPSPDGYVLLVPWLRSSDGHSAGVHSSGHGGVGMVGIPELCKDFTPCVTPCCQPLCQSQHQTHNALTANSESSRNPLSWPFPLQALSTQAPDMRTVSAEL